MTTPSPPGVREIAVLPVDDAHGDGLPIRWPSIAGLLGNAPPAPTVPGLLVEQLRSQLADKGFVIVDPAQVERATRGSVPKSPAESARLGRAAGLPAPVTYARLARWEAEPGVSPDFITVDLELMLVDPATAKPLWSAHWPTRPVPTGGSGSYAVAAERAAREVVARMIADLRASTPPDVR